MQAIKTVDEILNELADRGVFITMACGKDHHWMVTLQDPFCDGSMHIGSGQTLLAALASTILKFNAKRLESGLAGVSPIMDAVMIDRETGNAILSELKTIQEKLGKVNASMAANR